MADMTTTFPIEEDEEPMATEPKNLSSDESEHNSPKISPNTTPDHQLECFYPDSINRLIASQLEQRSNMGTETIFSPPTPNTSMISDDEDPMNPTPIIGNACDGLVYSVNLNGQNSGTQRYALPVFED